MRTSIKVCGIAAGAAIACAAAVPQAHAAIECDGRYQIVQGNHLSTPYCEDNYLAYIGAQFHGTQYSAHEVRQNPYAKEQVCLIAGYDPRVADICIGHRPDHRFSR